MSDTHIEPIIKIITPVSVIHLYKELGILFTEKNLTTCLHSSVQDELAKNLTSYEVMEKRELIMNTLASCFLFIYTWIKENKKEELLNEIWATYANFINSMFLHISMNETNLQIKDLSYTLYYNFQKITKYLGPFKGHVMEGLYDRRQLLMVTGLSIAQSNIDNYAILDESR